MNCHQSITYGMIATILLFFVNVVLWNCALICMQVILVCYYLHAWNVRNCDEFLECQWLVHDFYTEFIPAKNMSMSHDPFKSNLDLNNNNNNKIPRIQNVIINLCFLRIHSIFVIVIEYCRPTFVWIEKSITRIVCDRSCPFFVLSW